MHNTRENYGTNGASKPRQKKVPMDFYNLPIEEATENKRLFYHIEIGTDNKRRSINPYFLKINLQYRSGMKADNLVTDSKNGFPFEIDTKEAMEVIEEMTEIEEQSHNSTLHKFHNESKGLINIQELDFTDEFKESLKEAYAFIKEAEVASFIKPRYVGPTAILITFNLNKPPYSLYVLGERLYTTFYAYIDRTLVCHNCYIYGHT